MRKYLVLSLICLSVSIVLFSVSAVSVQARHKGRVLAEATPAAELNFPPITSGPGFILPDSSLFFLDKLFQAIRLTIAIDQQTKARVRAQIAGERLAELRVMLARNNPQGIDVALSQLSKEVGLAAKSLSDASAQGKDVSALAKEINQTIKLQREILGTLSDQTSGDLRLRLKAAREVLKGAKIEVEDELPEDELENEIGDGLEEELEEEVEEASESARKVDRLLEKLQEEASKSAEKALKRREEAVRKAIEEKNKEMEKVQEDLKKQEEKKQEGLRRARGEAAEAARKATKEAQRAAEELKKAQNKVEEIKQIPVGKSGEKEKD